MKRDAAASADGDKEWKGLDEPLFEVCPLLAQAVADPWWEDGKARTPYSLKLAFTVGGVQVSISDETGRRTSYTAARTVQEALGLIERMLEGGSLAWRPWGRSTK